MLATDLRSEHALKDYLKQHHPELPEFPFWNHVGNFGMGSATYLGDGKMISSTHVPLISDGHLWGGFFVGDGHYYKPETRPGAYLIPDTSLNGAKTASELLLFAINPANRKKWSQQSGEPLSADLQKLGSVPVGAFQQGPSPVVIIGAPLGKTAASDINFPRKKMARVATLTVACGELSSTPDRRTDAKVREKAKFSTYCLRSDQGASPGDSGGAVFQFNHDRWELVGVVYAVLPAGRIGNIEYPATTLSVDLSKYMDPIKQFHGVIDDQPTPQAAVEKAAAVLGELNGAGPVVDRSNCK